MDKIRFKVTCFLVIISYVQTIGVLRATAQQPVAVQNAKDYQQSIQQDSLQQLVRLDDLIPSLQTELRYATKKNFTAERLYPKKAKAFLRRPAAIALQAVVKELADSGYGLKIWDAYRPHAATKKMWVLVADERYVANPAKGSNHNRGLAVDLTLTKDGKELDMGTGFDNFSDTAHHDFMQLPDDVLKRRKLLRSVMERHGFAALETEWWHYAFTATGVAVLDVPFEKL